MKTYYVTLHRTYTVKVSADSASEARNLVERGMYRTPEDITLDAEKVGRAYEEE